MEEVNKQEMHKQGFCPIERKITSFRRLPNKKWICESSGCSMAAGNYKEVPKLPKKHYL